MEGLTPEAREKGRDLIAPDAQVYRIDDAELERVRASYPVMWKKPGARPKLAFIGCPHLSATQLERWADDICEGLATAGHRRVQVPTVLTAAPAVAEAFRKTDAYARLATTGAVVSSICPLMYTNNPLCGGMPIVTNSNKLRTYSTARYCTDHEVLECVTTGALAWKGGNR